MRMNLSNIITIICLTVSMLILTKVSTAYSEEITRLSLDSVGSLGTKIEGDHEIKTEGKGSIKITTQWPASISFNLGKVNGLDVDNSKLIFQAKVKSRGLDGTAFLEMWCSVGEGWYFSRGMDSTVTGNMDWQTLNTPFILQKGQKAKKAVLNIVINGKGIVWIDDIRLITEPLK